MGSRWAFGPTVIGFVVALCLLANDLSVASAHSDGQSRETSSEQSCLSGTSKAPECDEKSDLERTRLYDQMALDYGRALGYSLLFPGLGNIYVEQYVLAGISFSLMAFSVVFAGYGLTTGQMRFTRGGVFLAGGVYAGASASSLLGVAHYNRRLRRELGVEGSNGRRTPINRSAAIGLRIRF